MSCATLSATPLVRGKWLKKGAHLDLVGAYTPKMRESDDDAVKRARVYVDTRAGAPKEGGDIAQPLKSGVLKKDGIRGDLFELCRGEAKGRTKASEITLFKSVGTAIEDLAAAMLVWRALGVTLTRRESALEPRPPCQSWSKSAACPRPTRSMPRSMPAPTWSASCSSRRARAMCRCTRRATSAAA